MQAKAFCLLSITCSPPPSCLGTEHTHTHTHTHKLQTNRRAAQRRVRMSVPRQLVIKQDKACSTPVGAFLRGQARSSDLVRRRKKDGAALWQYRPELTTTSPGYHLPFQIITEQGRYAPCDVYVSATACSLSGVRSRYPFPFPSAPVKTVITSVQQTYKDAENTLCEGNQ